MKHRYLHRLYGRSALLRKLVMGIRTRAELVGLGGHKDPQVLDLIRRTRRERESLLSGTEAFLVHSLARAQRLLPGAMAEVGVYQGCSAKLISLASGGRPLHLFDTFAGLPEPEASERRHLKPRQYNSSLASVRAFMAGERNVVFHPGCFPETARGLEEERFSFVHLDVDLKSSTRACLEFFHPRMVPGGIIMTHDYSFLDGVREAFAEFLAERGGHVIELPTSQALLVCAGEPMVAANAPALAPSRDYVPGLQGTVPALARGVA